MGRDTSLDAEHPVPMDRLVQLLSTPDTKVLAARHVAHIQAFCRNNASGFWVADLGGICSILELTIEAIKAGSINFVECMCLMLRCGSSIHSCSWPMMNVAHNVAAVMQGVRAALEEKAMY